MKILTNSSYNLTVDSIIKAYCMSHLPNETPVVLPTQPAHIESSVVLPTQPAHIEAPVAVSKKPVVVEAPVAVSKKPSAVKKTTVEPPKKQSAIPKVPVASSKLNENSDIESSTSSDSDSEVDMIVSKVSESLKPALTEESGSEPEDSDDCMLDADEIHDQEGNTYYIDEAKSVIKLDGEGYGERLGMLKEFKSGNIFYKNKRWKIEYFPKK